MARGITETDVHTAADELVAAGERPTVDRIRAHLGTGSPNTVTRWLETWWRGLAPRLLAYSAQQAIPELPAPVSRLAQQLWEQAVGIARNDAEQALAQDRLQVDGLRGHLESREGERQAQLRDAAAAADQARQALAATEQRLADLQHASSLQQEQFRELSAQRAALGARCERLEVELTEQHRRAALREEAVLAERDAQVQHARGIEDRAHAEIDRARQEAKNIRIELTARVLRLDADMQALLAREEAGRHALSQAEQEGAAQRARADTLERQLQQAHTSRAKAQKARAEGRKVKLVKTKSSP